MQVAIFITLISLSAIALFIDHGMDKLNETNEAILEELKKLNEKK